MADESEQQDVLLELVAKVDQLTYVVNVLMSDISTLLGALPAPARIIMEQRRVLFNGHVLTLYEGQYHLDGFTCSLENIHALLIHFNAAEEVFQQLSQLGTIQIVR